jgi:hypothetical protein
MQISIVNNKKLIPGQIWINVHDYLVGNYIFHYTVIVTNKISYFAKKRQHLPALLVCKSTGNTVEMGSGQVERS